MTRKAALWALLAVVPFQTGATAQEAEPEDGFATSPQDRQETPEARRITLEEAIAIGLRASPALQQSRASVEIAEFDRLNSYGTFLPSVSLNYGFSDASTGRLDPTGQAITRTNYTAQLQASVDLFDGLRRFSDLRSARRSVEAEETRYTQREYETMLEVKTAFYDAVANRELVQVEADRVERQEEQLEFVRQQVELGRATRSDLLRSQVDLNDARLELLNAENQARASTFALAQSIGSDERVAPAREATLETAPLPYGRDELQAAALESGPAVVSARAAGEAAEARVSSARSSFLPSLRFGGGWAWQAADFPPENRSWSLSLSGSYPLFDGFQRETGIARARAELSSARADQRATELALRADLDEAYSQAEAARGGVDLAEQSVDLAREDLRLTRERFRLGLATILDLRAAQITLAESEANLVRQRFDYQIGLAQLEMLLGSRLEGDSLRPGAGEPR